MEFRQTDFYIFSISAHFVKTRLSLFKQQPFVPRTETKVVDVIPKNSTRC